MKASPSAMYVTLESVTRAGPASYLLPRSSFARDAELVVTPIWEKLSVTRDCLDLVLLRAWCGASMRVLSN